MTKAEIAHWLGFPPEYRIAPRLLEGMASVANPDGTARGPELSSLNLAAFRAFLQCAGPPGARHIAARPTLLGGRLDP